MRVFQPYLVWLGWLVVSSMWPDNAFAQVKGPVHLDVPTLALAMLDISPSDDDAGASTALPPVPPTRNFPASGTPNEPRTGTGRMFAVELIGSTGVGLAAAGAFHIARAESRASGCHDREDEVVREEQMRRTGWALVGVGSALAVGALVHWTIARVQGTAPTMTRGQRVAVGLAPVGVATVSSAFLWVGTIFRSLHCFHS